MTDHGGVDVAHRLIVAATEALIRELPERRRPPGGRLARGWRWGLPGVNPLEQTWSVRSSAGIRSQWYKSRQCGYRQDH